MRSAPERKIAGHFSLALFIEPGHDSNSQGRVDGKP